MSAEKQQLLQEVMIERVRELCHEEDRLVAAMMYGSFAQGEGDEFPDIEFILFFDDYALKSVDQEGWVSRALIRRAGYLGPLPSSCTSSTSSASERQSSTV